MQGNRMKLKPARATEHTVAAQPVELLLCPPLDLDESVGANQHSIDRHHQQFNQVVFDLARLPRVADRYEYVRQAQFAFRLRGLPQKDRKLQNSSPCEQPLATV